MFIWDFVADKILGQIVDWFYGQVVGFLGNFFSEMGNMGAELFTMDWVQSIVLFFSYLAWALYGTGLVVACFETGVEYSSGRGNIRETALNAIKGFMAVSLFTVVPVRLYELCVSLQGTFTAALTGYGTSIGDVAGEVMKEFNAVESISNLTAGPLLGFGSITSGIMILFCIILMAYAIIKVFFANLKRGGILLIQIAVECIILSVNDTYMDAQEVMHMTDYSKITALYSRLSVGDEDRDGGESNSIQNQKIFLENYAKGQHLTNIRHYIDDDESGRFFDRSAYSRMIEDVESGKIGVCIMKDLTRWGRDYLQVGNAMEIFRRNNVRFIAVNNGIDSENPDTLEFAPFINIMSEWYAKDISKKVKTGIKTKGMSGKPVATEAPYGYIKDPDNRDFWIIDEEAAEVVRLIFRLFLDGKNRNQITVYLTQEQIPTPTFYMKDRGRGTCKNKTLNEDNRYKWNKATLTHILTRQEYCGDVVNFKTTKHFRDKRNHYVDRSQWHITENVHEPIIDRTDFENVQRILENAPVKRPNGDGEIHPLSGLLFCKDCGAKMHIRIDYRNGGKRHVAYCSEYHKGKAKNPKCSSPHIMDADLLMQTVADVLKKIAEYSISNRAEFEALVKKSLAMQQTDKTKKQQKRIPQITTRLEQIDKVLNKLYEDNALGTIPQDRYEQMSQKYSEEYYSLKAELEQLREQLSAFENAGGRAQKFVKLIDRYADFTDLTPTILNEFISRIEVHERDKKRAKQAIQHIGIYFNHIGRFENELTQLAEPTEQEIRQMREEIEEARKEKNRAYHRNYSREYRARNLEKQREYDRIKAREYRAKKKAQAAAALSAP